MADLKNPGLILTFGDDDVWFLQLQTYDELDAIIKEIKEKLVGSEGIITGAQRVGSNDNLNIENAELNDIYELLNKGISIRPCGR